MNTELSFFVVTGYSVEFTPAFSFTPPTIQKSGCIFFRMITICSCLPNRVLIATIRDLGSCPCPRCSVTKEAISKLGTDADRESRRVHVHEDTAARRTAIEKARKLIYRDGYVVNSALVEALLKEHSWVPTEVR